MHAIIVPAQKIKDLWLEASKSVKNLDKQSTLADTAIDARPINGACDCDWLKRVPKIEGSPPSQIAGFLMSDRDWQ